MIKPFLAKQLAKYSTLQTNKLLANPVKSQLDLLDSFLKIGKQTKYGNNHNFHLINKYEDYKQIVPIIDYEQIKDYVNSIIEGEPNVLWKGLPLYFNKTSGTTSGVKYIPMTKESLPHNIKAARSSLLSLIREIKSTNWVNGKMIFLSGSPELETKGKVKVGRMSGIVNHHIPAYLRRNQLPSYKTNCIGDWEEKLNAIVEETVNENMTLISGIPPWVQMYLDRILEKTGKKTIKEVFPNLKVIVHGGVNFKPYASKMYETVGNGVSYIETYPSSEGFIAYQNSQIEEGLLLNLDAGIFYEFIPADEVFNDKPTRLHLGEVELNKNYALLLTTNAGLWSYLIGDTVKFVSIKPHKIVVTGRTKHFISAFGEHVIGEEVDAVMTSAVALFKLRLKEFTVVPQVSPNNNELPYHEWYIELEREIEEDVLTELENTLDEGLRAKNSYYDDLITGNILQPLKVRLLPPKTFDRYMSSIGKLGGQNKVPRLGNNRKIADAIDKLIQ